MGGSVHRFRERPCIPWLLDHALSGAPSSSAEWPSQSYCLPCAWTPARRASPPLRGRVARVGGVVRMLRCGWTSSVGGTCSVGLSKARSGPSCTERQHVSHCRYATLSC
jgi:hypothetical protein